MKKIADKSFSMIGNRTFDQMLYTPIAYRLDFLSKYFEKKLVLFCRAYLRFRQHIRIFLQLNPKFSQFS